MDETDQSQWSSSLLRVSWRLIVWDVMALDGSLERSGCDGFLGWVEHVGCRSSGALRSICGAVYCAQQDRLPDQICACPGS